MNRWDYLIVTASHAEQADAYRAQLEIRRRAGLLASARQVLAIPDLEGRRIGSGGSTLECLRRAVNRERRRGEAVRDVLARLRILIVHAGGDSRRLPAYGPCGKIFVPVPGDGRPACLRLCSIASCRVSWSFRGRRMEGPVRGGGGGRAPPFRSVGRAISKRRPHHAGQPGGARGSGAARGFPRGRGRRRAAVPAEAVPGGTGRRRSHRPGRPFGAGHRGGFARRGRFGRSTRSHGRCARRQRRTGMERPGP